MLIKILAVIRMYGNWLAAAAKVAKAAVGEAGQMGVSLHLVACRC